MRIVGGVDVANFRTSAWTSHLSYHEPDPADAAHDLHASALNANYTWARSYGSSLQTLRSDRIYLQNTGAGSGA